jgi:acetolactate synthase-1/2/3 large subunit
LKYAEYLLSNLAKQEEYTHCYFVAGGNTMHLLDSARKLFKCIPVINEVAAGIAAEYFNQTNPNGKRAFALVTAGPGITNIVTAMAGAFLESRELLVIGGQVKTQDLKPMNIRQRGIQEIDGVKLVESITVSSTRIDSPIEFESIQKLLVAGVKPGPVFIEIPLDVQGSEVDFKRPKILAKAAVTFDKELRSQFIDRMLAEIKKSSRPVLLLGGGISRNSANLILSRLTESGIPVMTTWNGMDRYGTDQANFWGRPNTWGQRSSNILIQQADVIIALGTRLGLQQTGFAWKEFAPLAKIFQVDLDPGELEKGHPVLYSSLADDADLVLREFMELFDPSSCSFHNWLKFGESVLEHFPHNERSNHTSPGFISPYSFIESLSKTMSKDSVFIPCSSGGAFTVSMQAFNVKFGQKIVTNKGLASMGYGLSGAIGAAESTGLLTVLVEGDGGFAQNLQELGTAMQGKLNLKMFIFSNSGYASIRMTQKNYFDGAYLGCDVETGLGLPELRLIAEAYKLPFTLMSDLETLDKDIQEVCERVGPELIEVRIDPEQTYYPKITSRILSNGAMESNPLHLMTPDLSPEEINQFLPYLSDRL